MYKNPIPRTCHTVRSPRPNFINNPRPPRVPPPPSSARRNFQSQRQRQRTQFSTNNEENKNTDVSIQNELPPFPEDPPPRLTPSRIRVQKLLDELFCRSELMWISDYASNPIDFHDSKALKRLKSQYQDRDVTPIQLKEVFQPSSIELCFDLLPIHNLDVLSFLHFQSDSLLSNLSTIFNTPLTESKLNDPNPTFNSLLQALQSKAELFTKPYKPHDKIPFPFIVCIGGPAGSGKTTVCQFFQKAFDCNILHVKYVPSESSPKKSKTATQQNLESTFEKPPEYPLENSIEVVYSDEKLAAKLITDSVKDHFDGRGFIIDGFPNNKNQQTALDKALSAANLRIKPLICTRGGRDTTKSGSSCIDGIIVTLFNDGDGSRLIDPVTGNIFKVGFHTPSLTELIGVNPPDFEESIREIQSRLVEVNMGEVPLLQPKVIQQYKNYANGIEKSIQSTLLGECERSLHVLEILDSFVKNLYAKNSLQLPIENPLTSLLRPTSIVLPELCYSAFTTWRKCLEKFGKIAADQCNLISTFSPKVDDLSKAAMERFQLLTVQKDERKELCDEFMKNRDTQNMAAHFRKIWDISIKIRERNLNWVDSIIDNSGLIELLLEIRKSPKIIFISLVHRLLNIMWFTEKFSEIPTMVVNDNTRVSFFDDLVVPKIEIPDYNFMSTVKINNLKPVHSLTDIHKMDSQVNLVLDSTTNTSKLPKLNKAEKSVTQPNNMNFPPRSESYRSSRNPNPSSQRPMNNENLSNQKENEIEKKKIERKRLADIGGYNYLIEKLGNLRPRNEEQIFFDLDRACAALGIIKMESQYSFEKQPIKFAEAFFEHIAKMLDSKMVEQEVKISLKLFRRFATSCKKKEAQMVVFILDLRDALISYATNKCTHEMEMFSQKFRYLKQGGTQLNSPLFCYDLSKINEDVLHLADLAVLMPSPIHQQDLLSVPKMFEIAQHIVNKGQSFASITDFLSTVKECKLTEFEMYKLEIAIRVMECIECFNTKNFLMSFVRTREDEMKMNDIFNKPPQDLIVGVPHLFPKRPKDYRSASQLSDSSNDEEEEEEEEAEIENENQSFEDNEEDEIDENN